MRMIEEETSREEAEEEAYELDLDQNSDADLAKVLEDAVAAVDRDGHGGTSARKGKKSKGEGLDADNWRGAEGDQAASGNGEDDASTREQLLRTLADFDNYRKRSDREKEALRKYAIFDVVKAFLSVIDNLERALSASGTVEDLKQGVEMILRQQDEMLRKQGVVPVESVGKTFDPSVHEAVLRQDSEDGEITEPTVITEFQRGYLLHDRLLRPAMVTVVMPQKSSSAENDDAPRSEEEEA